MDGGLDLDFHGFTRLFHARGWLTDADLDLYKRFYPFARNLLLLPDLIIALSASPQTITERLASRDRVNIATNDDTDMLTQFIDEWLEIQPDEKGLKVDTSNEGKDYPQSIEDILKRMETL